jgi:hypothetical protein
MVKTNIDLGELKIVDLISKQIIKVEILKDSRPVVIRFHPKKANLLFIGYKSGSFAFVDV